MKKLLSVYLLGLLFLACKQTISVAPNTDDLEKLLFQQQDEWNKGDIEAFMQTYWQSDSLLFYGSSGSTYGWNNTLENYRRRYPDRAAMGNLTFEIEHLSSISETSCMLMGTYYLKRNNDELSGYFTLIWKLIDNEWKIIADMTCAL